ncbi:MAG: FG-GAP repeat protein [Planctomycetes bacterium]|nr:FG-GAP repeat protein [Planctomycetota bacterium]
MHVRLLTHLILPLVATPSFAQWTNQQDARIAPTPNDLLTNDEFGRACALDGSTLVLGAHAHDPAGAGSLEGAVYVFDRSLGVWSQSAKLVSSTGDANGHFGWSVALESDRLAIGASQEDQGTNFTCGALYVFERSAGVWTEQARLLASDRATLDKLGGSIDLSDDTLVAGAANESSAGTFNNGAAYVFVKNGANWTEQAKLLAPAQASSDFFGAAVVVDGDRIVVGAPSRDPAGLSNAGAAFVYQRIATVWTHVATLTPSDAAASDAFGSSLALDGDTLIVGAPLKLQSGTANGAAYVFKWNGTSWAEEAKLVDIGTSLGDQFGTAVDLDGDHAVVGLPLSNVAGAGTGGVQFFERVGSAWTGQVEMVGDACEAFDNLGAAVAISGVFVASGAPRAESLPTGNVTGEAYVFEIVPPPTVLSYCTAKTNSQGCSPTMAWTGFPSASNPNPFDLTCAQVLNLKWGLLFYGMAPASFPFQGGTLCVAPPIERTTVQNSFGSGSGQNCTGTYTYDMNARIQSGLDPNLVAGAAGFAQYWSRDPADPFTTSLSNAVEFHIEP